MSIRWGGRGPGHGGRKSALDWFTLQSGNLVTNPDAFDAASWTKTELPITANNAVAPDSTTTMDLAVPSTVAGLHVAYSNVAAIAGPVTITLYAKASGYSKLGIRESNVAGSYATYNLAGSVIESGNAGGYTVTNTAITLVAPGIYRCSLLLTPPGSASINIGIYVLPDTYTTGNPNDVGWAGDAVKGILFWRAQFYP